MEMTVERASVYIPVGKINTPDDVNRVVFAPIYKVNYEVESSRIGQIMDYDKLTIDVWSNGRISLEGATITATRIMNSHLRLFKELIDKSNSVKNLIKKEEGAKAKIIQMSIESLYLSDRTYNCLKRNGVSTLEELTQKTEEDINMIHNLGRRSLKDMEFKLKELGLSFRTTRKRSNSMTLFNTGY